MTNLYGLCNIYVCVEKGLHFLGNIYTAYKNKNNETLLKRVFMKGKTLKLFKLVLNWLKGERKSIIYKNKRNVIKFKMV